MCIIGTKKGVWRNWRVKFDFDLNKKVGLTINKKEDTTDNVIKNIEDIKEENEYIYEKNGDELKKELYTEGINEISAGIELANKDEEDILNSSQNLLKKPYYNLNQYDGKEKEVNMEEMEQNIEYITGGITEDLENIEDGIEGIEKINEYNKEIEDEYDTYKKLYAEQEIEIDSELQLTGYSKKAKAKFNGIIQEMLMQEKLKREEPNEQRFKKIETMAINNREYVSKIQEEHYNKEIKNIYNRVLELSKHQNKIALDMIEKQNYEEAYNLTISSLDYFYKALSIKAIGNIQEDIDINIENIKKYMDKKEISYIDFKLHKEIEKVYNKHKDIMQKKIGIPYLLNFKSLIKRSNTMITKAI